MTDYKPITFKVPENELEHLKKYCEQTSRTQTDVLRESIRKLKLVENNR